MTAVIPLTDKLRIELDTYAWALAKRKPRKDNRKQWEQFSWHRTFHQAVTRAAELQLAHSNAEGVHEVLDALAAISRRLEAAIRESRIPDSWLNAKQTGMDQ